MSDVDAGVAQSIRVLEHEYSAVVQIARKEHEAALRVPVTRECNPPETIRPRPGPGTGSGSGSRSVAATPATTRATTRAATQADASSESIARLFERLRAEIDTLVARSPHVGGAERSEPDAPRHTWRLRVRLRASAPVRRNR